MSDYLTMISDNLLAYVFGSNVYMGLFILIVVTVMMFKMNFSLDAMVVILVPLILMMSLSQLGWFNTWWAAVTIGIIGLILSFLLIKVLKR